MDPRRVSPLQIPSEDEVPLFDPSGLSASLSAEDWNNSFDLSSVAAARLGIGSPRSQDGSLSASIGNLTRSDSNNFEHGSSASGPHRNGSGSKEVVSNSGDAIAESLKRGRRRRSSAFDPSEIVAGPSNIPEPTTSTDESSVGSKVRMWWQRNAPESVEDERGDTSDPTAVTSTFLPNSPTKVSKDLPHPSRAESTSRPPLRTAFTEKPQGTEVQSPKSMSPPTNPSVSRSPAADFLSNFSSMNSVISPPFASFDNRSLSYSPPRPGHRSLGTSLSGDSSRNGLPNLQSSDAWNGLGSVAAQLFDVNAQPLPGASPRLDDEGARVGPNGRYLLGKTIGFGGFSTVREGWDQCGEDVTQLSGASVANGPKGRKIAVKIVYHEDRDGRTSERAGVPSHELDIWTRLPAHQHILPLLHHESIKLTHPGSNPSRMTNAELLIMPFCDQGNLLDFVRSEGGPREVHISPNGDRAFVAAAGRSGSSSWIASSSGRTQAQLTRSSSMKSSVNGNEGVVASSGNRTGSGFVFSRPLGAHLGRVASMSNAVPSGLRTIHAGQAVGSEASSPASAAGSVSSESGLLRRMKSKSSRSQGVPIDAARETMRQLASALWTLHTKAHVLHGDLKLENVLGQGKTSWRKRQRQSSTTSQNDDRESDHNSLFDSIASLASSSLASRKGLFESDADMPCWRIADFGLAMVVGEGEGRNHATASPALVRALKEESVRLDSHQRPKGHKSGRGGSLAYTAPEYLRATQSTSGASSPARVAQTADQESEAIPSESPYAADMWALGCILYALLSGRLPFADSFEPRLQMKIAKAQWEMPARLRRRTERLAASAAAASASNGPSQRNSSGSLMELPEGQVVTDRFAFMNQKRSASVAPSAPAAFGVMDLSASLPSLLPRERQATMPAIYMDEARRTPKVHSEHVVGSAPGRASHLESFEINEEAKACAEVEEDPESDEDPDLDPAWDGLSWDRAAAREVLLGLLEPDPARRWTIERVCSSAWIRPEDQDAQPASLFDVAANRSSGTSNATAFGPAAGLDNEGRRISAASFNTAVPAWSSPSKSEAPLMFQKGSAEMPKATPERGRRSSSLARSRPANLATGSPSSSVFASTDIDGASYRRSRSTSRVQIGYRSSSRNRSTDISEGSTPNRDKEFAWLPHPLGASVASQSQRAYGVAGNRCDSPADSERRGRHPRIRMADLDENKTWTGDEDASSDSRSGSRSGAASRAVPIPIRGESQSRSRSRHSRESTSPDPMARRSISRSRSGYSMSHDPSGSATNLLYGRSSEVQPIAAAVEPERVQAQRSSTSRSRSRAPDTLAQLLGRGRSTSRPRGNLDEDRPSSGLGISNYHQPHQPSGAWNLSNHSLEERSGSPLDERGSKQTDNREAEPETRGRARDRKG